MVGCSPCCCCWKSENDSSAYTENGIVSERHYGCYRLGILVALAILMLLVIGTVPVFFATDNSKLILTVTIITVLVVGILVFVYYEWQHRQALNQRDRSRDEWNVPSRTTEQIRNNRRTNYTDTLNSTSMVFWTTKKVISAPPPSSNVVTTSSTPPPKYSQV